MNQINYDWKEKLKDVASPYVSIIVPVYNVQATLYNCLMSVVFQTLPETEVVVVNDASPDDSQAIIDEFTTRFPDKVRCVVHEQNQGLAYARRTGLREAKAPYVIFVDSDDFVSGQLCADLLQEIVTKDLDMVYFPALRYWIDKHKGETLKPPEYPTQEELIKQGLAAFWGAIYRKDFLLQYEDIAFLKMLFEDAAATPALISRTSRISALRHKPYYFYRYGRADSICFQQISKKKMEDLFKADNIGLKNVLPQFQYAYASRVITRACSNLWKEPAVYDYSVLHVKEIADATKEYSQLYPASCQRILDSQVKVRPDAVLIPKIVYINGFMREQVQDFSKYQQEAKKAYLFDPEVCILDKTTCNLEQLPRWLLNASREEWGVYFALKEIAKQGGIYISPAVRIVTSFNREAFRGAFFASGGNTSVLLCAFGGEPNNYLLEEIIKLIENPDVAWNRQSISDCIVHVLIAESGVHLNGQEEFSCHRLHVLSFADVVRSTNPERSYCMLDYSNIKMWNEEMVCLPRHLDEQAWKYAGVVVASAQNATSRNAAKTPSKEEQNFKKIQRTRIYKMAKKIYRLLPGWLKKWLWK